MINFNRINLLSAWVSINLLLIAPAAADDILGIAFVQAVEQSTGMCFATNPDKAFKCAREKCMSNGTSRGDCQRVKWCYAANWSADLFVQHREGIHWHEFLCGWGSKNDLIAAAKVHCEGENREFLIECSIVGAWNGAGKEQQINYSLPPPQ